MTTRVAIYQPQYFPRLHYVNRVLEVDLFVLLTSAQYTGSLVHRLEDGRRERRKSFQSHTPIKQHDGQHLLTVPVTGGGGGASIAHLAPDDRQGWRARHRNAIKAAYGRAPQFPGRFGEVETLLRTEGSLAHLDATTLLWALDVLLDLGLGVEHLDVEAVNEHLHRSSSRLRRVVLDTDLGVERPEGRQMGATWTAAICAALSADEYLHGGTAGAGYMDAAVYEAHGIRLVQQDWHGPVYPQQFESRSGFVANLSILDLLFNVEPDAALDVVWPGGVPAAREAARPDRVPASTATT